MNENTPVKIDYSDSKTLALLKNTVAQGATDAEFALFLEYCKSTKLNPFKKEVWFIKGKDGRIQMMTGINGFYAIANDHPQFDGLEVDVLPAEGKPIKAVARCYRKDRSRPMVAEAYFQEYGKTYGNWTTMPRVMISKCAESMVLRKSFPQELNGLYTTEEMPEEFQGRTEQPKRQAKEYRYNLSATKKFIEPGQESAIKARLKKDYGATFDKESGELVTKKPINGWEEALTINIKEARAVHDAMGDDDLPDTETGEVYPIDDDAEQHLAAMKPVPQMTIEEAQAEVKKMKGRPKKTKDEPYVYVDKDIQI